MTDTISGMIDYIATDPEGLGMEPDATGKPALLGGVRRRWPTATDGQIAVAVKSAIIRAQELAAACFAEADALDPLHAARTCHRDRPSLTLVQGGRGTGGGGS